ncbi:hypothetical protein C923_04248 [Plasmodium falciparum UGT5.1]|uniref:Uncharacterized protein n=2 Tax=Plasmodium falciparum TaxID=5833 RepID=W7JU69_PLAFA|nr:hypothetical protein PFNF135_04336 [Plasmodium falciparum NF135/5.C10]EWC75061.1 hypothetical protein C923_04248 [Plasmodium falciparum UGT5.1]
MKNNFIMFTFYIISPNFLQFRTFSQHSTYTYLQYLNDKILILLKFNQKKNIINRASTILNMCMCVYISIQL